MCSKVRHLIIELNLKILVKALHLGCISLILSIQTLMIPHSISGPVYSTSDSSVIAPAGTYNTGTHTITWQIGEVGSKKGGYANVSINVRNDAKDGSQIINYGTVYFPSVPEETRTNSIVSIVGLNYPPQIPNNPSPEMNEIHVPAPVFLQWSSDDPNNDRISYDIYFGNSSSLQLLQQDSFTNSTFPGGLEYNSTYSWQVVARDPEGAEIQGPVWKFTTNSKQPPLSPSPASPIPPPIPTATVSTKT